MNEFLKNKPDIIAWLDQYKITNYKLIEDDKYGYVVDVDGDTDLSGKSLKCIPIKFGNINGCFSCGYNELTSLENCPHKVNGLFDCGWNNLTSLEFCPIIITGYFYCRNNNITNLTHFPNHIGGNIYLENNNLTKIDMDKNKSYNFEEVYSIHLEHKIVAEKKILENISNKSPVKTTKQTFKL